MNFVRLLVSIFVGLAAVAAQANAAPESWQKIDVAPGVYTVSDGNGAERQIMPSCSGGPLCTTDLVTGLLSCHLGSTQYSFYFKPGKQKNLLVYFDFGGACWDANTCVTGALTPLPSYVAELGTGADPSNKSGLFNLANRENPYSDWSMVVLPYCTGDIHWGSKDQVYTDDTGAVTGTPGGAVTIHHRGFDNFLYVRDWIQQKYAQKGDERSAKGDADEDSNGVKKLLVTGSSAGAYGAVFAYPHLKQLFPRAKGYLMADAGNGVVADSFLDQAVDGLDPRWGIQSNLAHWIPGMDAFPTMPASIFLQSFYSSLAGYYPADRFSEYTTLWDSVQTLFYNIMLNQDNIPAWAIITPEVYGSWVEQMNNHIFSTAANPNYRYYVAEGCNHTLLSFDDDFYKPATNQDVGFLSWFKALTGETGATADWRNSYCSNCDLAPTQEQVSACIGRSFAP